MSKGHRSGHERQVPLVVSDKVQEFSTTTKQAVSFLRQTNSWADIQKVYKSQRTRAGKGKLRNIGAASSARARSWCSPRTRA